MKKEKMENISRKFFIVSADLQGPVHAGEGDLLVEGLLGRHCALPLVVRQEGAALVHARQLILTRNKLINRTINGWVERCVPRWGF